MSKVRISNLLKACRSGDMNSIQKMLSQAPELVSSAESEHGWTPLYRAVTGGHLNVVFFLLSKGADVCAMTKMGESVLHQAADNNYLEIASLLFEFEASPNVIQNDGDTPLHYAAFKGHAEMVELLLECGADPNIQNLVFGRTPLHYAVDYGHLEVVQVLLENSANKYIKDREGLFPSDLSRFHEISVLFTRKPTSLYTTDSSPSSHEHKKERDFTLNIPKDRHPALYSWLACYRLEELYEVLSKADLNDWSGLTDDMLASLGVAKPGLRRRFLAALYEEANPKPHKRTETQGLFKCCVFPSRAETIHVPPLIRWLEQLNLEGLYRNFTENGYDDLEQLLALMHTPWALSDLELRDIGVLKIGHRHRILSRLKEDSVKVESMKKAYGGFSTQRRREEIMMARKSDSCRIM